MDSIIICRFLEHRLFVIPRIDKCPYALDLRLYRTWTVWDWIGFEVIIRFRARLAEA